MSLRGTLNRCVSLGAQPCNYGPLTAHRLAGAGDLIAAINRCCDVRGDRAIALTDNRVGQIAECLELPAYQQVDMREHFEAEAD